jgi:hypothetical protein
VVNRAVVLHRLLSDWMAGLLAGAAALHAGFKPYTGYAWGWSSLKAFSSLFCVRLFCSADVYMSVEVFCVHVSTASALLF